MKNTKAFMKPLAVALLASAGLAGCAVVPAYGPGYGPEYGHAYGHAYGPEVYGPVIVPSISIGIQSGGGHRYRGGRRGRR